MTHTGIHSIRESIVEESTSHVYYERGSVCVQLERDEHWMCRQEEKERISGMESNRSNRSNRRERRKIRWWERRMRRVHVTRRFHRYVLRVHTRKERTVLKNHRVSEKKNLKAAWLSYFLLFSGSSISSFLAPLNLSLPPELRKFIEPFVNHSCTLSHRLCFFSNTFLPKSRFQDFSLSLSPWRKREWNKMP